MSIVVYKEYRPLRDGKRKAVRVPHTLYTIDEADRLGVPYERDWRTKFRDLIDLSGKNIVTDDDPPMVVPVIKCLCCNVNPRTGDSKRPFRKLILPWTPVASYRRKIYVGVPATVKTQVLVEKKKRLKQNHLKLFVVMLALMNDPMKVVRQLFGFKTKVEQGRFLRMIVGDPRTSEAAESVARDIFSKAGIDPVEVLKKLAAILDDDETPVGLKIKGFQDLLDRAGVREKDTPQQPTGLLLAGMMPSPLLDMPDKLKSMMDSEVGQLPEKARARLVGDNGEE